MIAVSEPPLEFTPRGRPAVEEHLNSIEHKSNSRLLPEYILLQRLHDVNLSSKNSKGNEFWCIRETYEDDLFDSFKGNPEQVIKAKKKNLKKYKKLNNTDAQKEYIKVQTSNMFENLVNAEEELYVKNNIAIWTKGLPDGLSNLPHLSFTCDTPIKFAFFCPTTFLDINSKKKEKEEGSGILASICLIDEHSLHAYCANGEDYVVKMEFPVSKVWLTKFGVLLEKVPSTTILQNHNICMPRLFSLAHPLQEICPVLIKSSNAAMSYIIEPEHRIVFSDENSDLLLLYDTKIGKHFLSQVRNATPDEIQHFIASNETVLSSSVHHGSNVATMGSTSISSGIGQWSGVKNSTARANTSNYSTHVSKFLDSAHSLGSTVGNLNRSSSTASPLSYIQSIIGQHSISAQDMRKSGPYLPPKPITPELCLEYIWTENSIKSNRDYSELASKAFMHKDVVGQNYMCYLLPRSNKLQIVLLNNYNSKELHVANTLNAIPAKDALSLKRLNIMAVLDLYGNVVLYTGLILISQVYVPNVLYKNDPSTRLLNTFNAPASINIIDNNNMCDKTPSTSFPRRSSLLPTKQKSHDSTLEEALHMLSPVQPLQQFTQRCSNGWVSLRDPAGNRFTIVCANGKMIRITLPLLNESKLLRRTLYALRHFLKREQYVQLIVKWYCMRNPPGSANHNVEQEWETFQILLHDLMGFSATLHDFNSSVITSFNAEEPKKRRKNDELIKGVDEHWRFVLNILGEKLHQVEKLSNNLDTASFNNVDTTACLFQMIPAIFYCMHLLYEDFKLDRTMHEYLKPLAKFLYQLAINMQLQSFTFHYVLDFPILLKECHKVCNVSEEDGLKMVHKELLHVPAPDIYKQLNTIINKSEAVPYYFVDGVNDLSRNMLQIISLIMQGHTKIKSAVKRLEIDDTVQSYFPRKPKRYININMPRSQQVAQLLICMGISREDIDQLPVALHVIIAECLENVRMQPPIGCCPDIYKLILRPELVSHAKLHEGQTSKIISSLEEDSLFLRTSPSAGGITHMETAVDDGMDNIDTKLLNLCFPDDMRIMEVRRMLSSAEPVIIDIVQSPGISDHEFIEEQEKQLLTLCTRTMTLPVGRGMLTLCTCMPSPTESMPVPKLCLAGKEPLKGATIEMTQVEFPGNMNLWPMFHNGVAAGLKISPYARDVDSTWIVFNKPKGQIDISTEHAGFLMALGLNGHLKSLTFWNMYDYLVKCDEITSVGLLLGISAARRGTMDHNITKMLCVHLEAFLPPTSMELDIPHNAQVAALLGMGLVHQGSAKRYVAEVFLQEIGRPPGPEMENSVNRESYSLAAGLGLGLITLGLGETPAGLADLQIADILHYYMVGGNKRAFIGSQKDKYKLPSFQVREGDRVNVDVTAPGATLALGLMFFNTGDEAVADWMSPPKTHYLLALVRPDLLLLRTIARGLILWSDVKADEEWLFNQFPANLRFDVDQTFGKIDKYNKIDHESITQAFCNVIAGTAFCIGLKYAGSKNVTAFNTLTRLIKLFLGFNGKYVGEYAGRNTIESGLLVSLLALSLVFAGSGNLEILRIIRYLRSRIGPQYQHVTYGSHMAIHMALGFLFLSAGRYTLANTPEAIAALVISLFPKFPINSNDNRYHLQAFRHLYVLAVEPRLFLPRDIDSGKLCLCNISVLEVGSKELKRLPMAPCILPELASLEKVIIDDPNYWPVSFEKPRNWDQLLKALKYSACIDIKKRSGRLSHLEDPDGLRSIFSQTLAIEPYICWDIEPHILERFSSEKYVMGFTDRFLHCNSAPVSPEERLLKQHFTMLFYNAVIKDKMHALSIYLNLYKHSLRIRKQDVNFNDVWQIKLIENYLRMTTSDHQDYLLFSKELVMALMEVFKLFLDDSVQHFRANLKQLITSRDMEPRIVSRLSDAEMYRFTALIIYYNLTPNLLNLFMHQKKSYLSDLNEFRKLNMEPLTGFCLLKLLGK